jgi:hypothetical protein
MDWLIKLLFFVMLAPFFGCLLLQLVTAAVVALLPWVIGLTVLMGLAIGIGVGLARRLRLSPRPHDRFPPGEIPRIRRPRGIRTER